jgi:Zn-finger nucleic acid-binding protein
MSTCPRDLSPLEARRDVFGAGNFASVCPKCAGVMAEWSQGQRFFESLGLAVKALNELVAASAGKARKTDAVPCTSCGHGSMKTLLVKGVELDLCEACGATWFDGSELSRLTKGKLGNIQVQNMALPVQTSEAKLNQVSVRNPALPVQTSEAKLNQVSVRNPALPVQTSEAKLNQVSVRNPALPVQTSEAKLNQVSVSGKRQADESSEVVGVFEMFWDCAFCDSKALLAASNRFCPNCGAQQDAKNRYFPPPGKEVAANVAFDGVDVTCPACQTPNGALAHHCKNCGSPLESSDQVATVAARSERPAQAAPAVDTSAKTGTRWWLWALGAVALLCCFFSAVATLWTKEENMKVVGHSWSREMAVEAIRPVPSSAWCDSLPMGAFSVSRHREQRSSRQIADGQDCSMRDVDRGNGTFERRRECRPRYRSEPIYADKCDYLMNVWTTVRSDTAQGRSLMPGPSWPASTASGGERTGSRSEHYTVELQDEKGQRHSCEVNESVWQAAAEDSQKKIDVGVLLGQLNCKDL